MYHDGDYDVHADGDGDNAFKIFSGNNLELVEDTTPLKVGDRVRCINGSGPAAGAGWALGREFTIREISGGCAWPEDEHDRMPRSWGVYMTHIELITNDKEDNDMSEVTNDPVKAIMEEELDADTRLLRQIGFEDSAGKVTDLGTKATVQSVYKERREGFAAKYRKALATESSAATDAKAKA